MTDDAFNFFPPPTPASLHDLADGLAELANAATELLCYDDHTELLLLKTKLRSYAELLSAADRETFLSCEVQLAEDILSAIHDRHAEALNVMAAENCLTNNADSAHDSTLPHQPQGARP